MVMRHAGRFVRPLCAVLYYGHVYATRETRPMTALSPDAALSNLMILVHPHMARLDAEFAQWRSIGTWAIVSIGRELAAAATKDSADRRAMLARDALNAAILTSQAETVLCTDLAPLFDPTWHIDALALFAQLARQRRLVLLWPGSYHEGVLSCATPEHAHHRTWPNPDAVVIPLR